MTSQSNEVRVFHWHIEALFYHGVVRVNIWAWPDDRLCTFLVVNAGVALGPETLFTGIEDDSGILKLLAPGLAHSLRAFCVASSRVLVQTWSWHLQLETLSIEDLIVIESRWGRIEADSLSCDRLVVSGSRALITPDIRVFDASDLIFYTEDGLLVVNMLALFTLCDNLGTLATLTFQNSHCWIIWHHGHAEAVTIRAEDSITHSSLLGQRSVHSTAYGGILLSAGCRPSCDSQINCWLCDMWLDVIGAGAWVLIPYVQPAVFDSGCIGAEHAKFYSLWLCQSPVLSNFCQALADGRIVWIIDINIGSRAWVRCFDILVAISFFLLLESDLNSFLL